MTRNIPSLIILFCIVLLLQVFGLSYLSLFNVTPDAVTIFIALVGVTLSQRASTTFGFAAGIVLGIFSENTGMVMGWMMLSRTVEGFIAGFFNIPENSHATTKQKNRRIYNAIIVSGLLSGFIISAVYNPLGFSPLVRIVALGILKTFLTVILAFLANVVILKKSLMD
ncbi:MAG: rod shape-determining protein MreD [Chlorobiaceae bacterium]|nr:rod shape-determining protein MreD [Chlorobiaceae bacterium]NTW11646.1 rod shape-determining protein MreD [Chlorobiaceae bacterium]